MEEKKNPKYATPFVGRCLEFKAELDNLNINDQETGMIANESSMHNFMALIKLHKDIGNKLEDIKTDSEETMGFFRVEMLKLITCWLGEMQETMSYLVMKKESISLTMDFTIGPTAQLDKYLRGYLPVAISDWIKSVEVEGRTITVKLWDLESRAKAIIG